MATASAVAQDKDAEPSQRVEITGTHLRAVSATAENVLVISADEIKRSGQPTVADYLRTVSANFAAFNETYVNSFAPGAAGMALRGLSQKNTLVLLDGRRIANFGFAQNLEDTFFDLNAIPAAAVARIEILMSGASAIYGSDATAGVVNIILKRNSLDREIDGGLTATTEGGGGTRDASLSFGVGDPSSGPFNVFTTLSVFKRDPLLASQRKLTAQQDFSNKPGGTFAWSAAQNYYDPASNSTTAFQNCAIGGLPSQSLSQSAFATSTTGTTCAYNLASVSALIPGSERANLTSAGTLKLSRNWNAYGDLFVSKTRTSAAQPPATLSSSSIAYDASSGGVSLVPNTLPPGNPSNPNATPTQINYLFASVGPRNYVVDANTYRLSAGVKGSIGEWDLDASFGHSESRVTQQIFNGINVFSLANAIQSGSFSFIDPGSTPAANDSLRTTAAQTATSKLDTLGVRVNGALAQLPSGPLNGAAGVEVRRETMVNRPNQALLSGSVLGYGLVQVDGSRNVTAVFGELSAPLTKALEGGLAFREERYSDAGRNFSPQASLRWQPNRWFTTRAVASRGFRAPSLPEISHASSTSFEGVSDPLDPRGRPFEPAGVVTQANPNLKPETSNNIDLGFVFSPSPDFSLSLDLYQIRVQNMIASQATANDIVNDPSSYPGQIVRAADGTLAYVTVPYENRYAFESRGVDVDVQKTLQFSSGRLRLNANATHVSSLRVWDGSTWTQYAGTNGWLWDSPLSGGGPVAKWKGSVSGTWETRDWNFTTTVNYTDSYVNNCFSDGACPQSASWVPSTTTVDFGFEYRGFKNWRLNAAIVNAFDRQPPWDWYEAAYGGFNVPYSDSLYDARGRYVQLRASYKF